MMAKQPIQIGIVLYREAQLAAVHGLTDLFAVADRIAVRYRRRAEGFLQVSHWRPGRAGSPPIKSFAAGKDTNTAPSVLLLPPRLGEPPTAADAEPFTQWLLSRHRAGATLGSVCAGAFVLGETGLLARRSVTTHWIHAPVFRSRFPEARLDADRLIIDDGDIITAGGMMSWTDLGLKLVDRFLGPTVMVETARFLLVDLPGREQRYYSAFSPNLTHGDAAIRKVQHWLQATGAKEMSLAALTARAGLVERTFLRRFKQATGLTPIEYCQRLRVGKARELLQFGRLPIDRIAWEVGYGDPGAFRNIFLRMTGLTPGGYRRRFSIDTD
jgi:transcriptional regulator GlxA family with amidase domain